MTYIHSDINKKNLGRMKLPHPNHLHRLQKGKVKRKRRGKGQEKGKGKGKILSFCLFGKSKENGREKEINVYLFCLVPKRREKNEWHFKFIDFYNMHLCIRNRKAKV
jgi:hypothetical protein